LVEVHKYNLKIFVLYIVVIWIYRYLVYVDVFASFDSAQAFNEFACLVFIKFVYDILV